jgi:hypothetical protein
MTLANPSILLASVCDLSDHEECTVPELSEERHPTCDHPENEKAIYETTPAH